MSELAANHSCGAAPGATWHELYQAAMLELDNSKMTQRIFVARHAILDRAEDLLTASPSDERGALNDALQALRILEQVAIKERHAA
jgi:hypothetical protein